MAKQPPLDGIGVDSSLLRTAPLCWRTTDPNLVPPRSGEMGSFSVGALITVKSRSGGRPGRVVILSGETVNDSQGKRGDTQIAFGVQCFEWLAERRELVAIQRSSIDVGRIGIGLGPDEIDRRVGNARWFLVYAVPLSFCALGVLVWWRRRKI